MDSETSPRIVPKETDASQENHQVGSQLTLQSRQTNYRFNLQLIGGISRQYVSIAGDKVPLDSIITRLTVSEPPKAHHASSSQCDDTFERKESQEKLKTAESWTDPTEAQACRASTLRRSELLGLQLRGFCLQQLAEVRCNPWHHRLSEENLNDLSEVQLFQRCQKSQKDSMIIESFVAHVHRYEPRRMERVVEAFEAMLPLLSQDRTGSFIVGAMIKISLQCRSSFERFCQKNLYRLVENKCAIKVMQVLVTSSPTFSDFYLAQFSKNFKKLCRLRGPSILANKAITSCGSLDSCRSLAAKVTRCLFEEVSGSSEVLRLSSSLLSRCPLDWLEGLLSFVEQNIWWLIDDKIGNYSVQELLRPKFRSIWPVLASFISQQPEQLFVHKYRKLLLHLALESKGFCQLLHATIDRLVKHKVVLLEVVKKREPRLLLTALTVNLVNPQLCMKLSKALRQAINEAQKRPLQSQASREDLAAADQLANQIAHFVDTMKVERSIGKYI